MKSRLSAAALAQAADPPLIALACAGDDDAYTEIVRRRQARVRKFMYHVCRDRALGDELSQQVFVTAWQSLRQLRTAAAFDGWLKRIMVTTWLEEARRRKLPLAADVEVEDAARCNEDVGVQLDLDAALARLPQVVRLCVVLAYSEGMAHPQIAVATGLPLGTVKSHITRGSARLRELLSAYAGGRS